MTAATENETIEWFRAQEGLGVDDSGPYYSDAKSVCVQLSVPDTLDGVLHLGRAIALLSSDVEEQFNGAAIWFTNCDALNPITDRIGWRIVEALRGSHGEHRPIDAAPGHFFRSDELVDFCTVLTCCLAFRWDAYVTTFGTEHFFVSVRSPGYVAIVSRDGESLAMLSERLSKFGLTPTPPPPDTLEHYCRRS